MLLLLCPNTPSPLPDATAKTAEPLALLATIAFVVAVGAMAVIVPAPKPPLESRFTIAFAVLLLVGATSQLNESVPLPVTGDPLTEKSELGALRPTLVTLPVPGNV